MKNLSLTLTYNCIVPECYRLLGASEAARQQLVANKLIWYMYVGKNVVIIRILNGILTILILFYYCYFFMKKKPCPTLGNNSCAQTARPRTTICRSYQNLFRARFEPASHRINRAVKLNNTHGTYISFFILIMLSSFCDGSAIPMLKF